MSVIMPKFLEPKNKKWIIEIQREDGFIDYKAKEDAPESIKKEINDWNKMFEDAKKNNIQL